MLHTSLGWIFFNLFVLAMLALDLMVFQKRDHVISIKEALWWSLFWTVLALIFNVGIYYVKGPDMAFKFFAGYLLERSLSIDNLFVFLLIFSYFAVDSKYQHKILFWGILGALVMRGVFIFAGITLLHYFHWMIYVFGAFLVYTGFKLFKDEDKSMNPEKNIIVRACKKIIPVTSEHHGQFFVKSKGRWFATNLFIVLLVVDVVDVVFAVDSIPAILSISRDSFIVYSSNVFAVFGLRALYFALAGMMRMFHYLNVGLAVILIFVGVKMLLEEWYKIPIGWTLAVIGGVLALSVVFSVINPKESQKHHSR